MTALQGGLVLCVLAAALTWAPFRAAAQDGAQNPPDTVMGTEARPGTTMTNGRNEQGDSVMRVRRDPKANTRQTPEIGPIMVVPQVNQYGQPGQGQRPPIVMPAPGRGSGR